MKIVILEAKALNPGDISFDGFKALGELTVYEDTKEEELLERTIDADIILVNKLFITRKLMLSLPRLKYIGEMATGYNNIDLLAAKERGITVTNVPSYASEAVAQHTMALLLECTNKVALHNESVHRGDWAKCGSFCYWLSPLELLSAKCFGVLGYGNIGRRVSAIARAFGMRVIAHTRIPRDGVQCVGLDELFSRSDVISLHAPLDDITRDVVCEKTLSLCKADAIIINTARGGLVDEVAVARALEDGRLGAYCCDVVSKEPMREDNPLLRAPRCIITPHLAWAPRRTREVCRDIALGNLKAYLEGRKENVL